MTHLIAMLLALSLVAGCLPEATQYTSYRLPLAGNKDPRAAKRCASECEVRYEEDSDYDQYTLRIESCPGVQVRFDEGCSNKDVPPRAVCATREKRVGTGIAIARTAAWLAIVAIVVGPPAYIIYTLQEDPIPHR